MRLLLAIGLCGMMTGTAWGGEYTHVGVGVPFGGGTTKAISPRMGDKCLIQLPRRVDEVVVKRIRGEFAKINYSGSPDTSDWWVKKSVLLSCEGKARFVKDPQSMCVDKSKICGHYETD